MFGLWFFPHGNLSMLSKDVQIWDVCDGGILPVTSTFFSRLLPRELAFQDQVAVDVTTRPALQ